MKFFAKIEVKYGTTIKGYEYDIIDVDYNIYNSEFNINRIGNYVFTIVKYTRLTEEEIEMCGSLNSLELLKYFNPSMYN